MAPWTLTHAPLQLDRIAVVTGANTGIGYVTARELARKGAEVVLACRNAEKGGAARARLLEEVPGARAELAALDLADLSSVRAFAEAFGASHQRLDLLINNAGIMMVDEGTTADGFERQIGTNHLGHFALTGLLLDRILATPDSRIVTVSSIAHRGARIDLDDLMMTRGGYNRGIAYGRSKLANLLFALELDRRLRAAGSETRSIAAHPGVAATDLSDHLFPNDVVRAVAKPVLRLLRGADDGALPILRAATDPTILGGQYVGPGGPGEALGRPSLAEPSEEARDAQTAADLWARSVELTGVTFDPLT